jgi:hypothetical protein
MKMKKILFTSMMFLSIQLFAQEQKLTKTEISSAVDSLSAHLNRIYVFPDKAKEMSDFIQKNLKDGKYDALVDPLAFSDQVTKDIISISNDKHLNFRFAPQRISEMRNNQNAAAPDLAEMKKEMGKDNFGFVEVKILPGNIGYIKFNGFSEASLAGDAASAAMNFVSYTDAIIFDVRENGGGSPSMIQLLTSYLYEEGESVHLNNFYFRPNELTQQTWTLPYVPGKRNPKAQVYVLTSNYTFSAAEEFTYNLKNLKRGTIIGETTGGGAHPGGLSIINDQFVCFIPNGRAINPITETNWEGVGVIPDVKVAKQDALNTAHILALDSLMKSKTDEAEINVYKWHKDILNAKIKPYQADVKKFKNYVGKFGPRSIFFENNALYYQRDGRPKFELSPLDENLFYIEEQGIKVQMEMKDNKIIAITILTEDGRSERNEKN